MRIFANGIRFRHPWSSAPEYIKGSIAIKVEEFISFLQQNGTDGWVNLGLKESKDGKSLYFELNTWKPETNEAEPIEEHSDPSGEIDHTKIPF